MTAVRYKYASNFWKINPEILALKTFEDIYLGDDSDNKEDSSNIMWTIYFSNDYNSQYFSLPPKDRFELIKREFLFPKYNKQEQNKLEEFFNSPQYKKLVDFYHKQLLNDSTAQYLMAQKASLENRAIYLQTEEYNVKTAEILDKLHLQTPKIIEALKDLEDRLQIQIGQIKGDQELSPLAKEEFNSKYNGKINLGSHGFNALSE
jgi:hypothetical protein